MHKNLKKNNKNILSGIYHRWFLLYGCSPNSNLLYDIYQIFIHLTLTNFLSSFIISYDLTYTKYRVSLCVLFFVSPNFITKKVIIHVKDYGDSGWGIMVSEYERRGKTPIWSNSMQVALNDDLFVYLLISIWLLLFTFSFSSYFLFYLPCRLFLLYTYFLLPDFHIHLWRLLIIYKFGMTLLSTWVQNKNVEGK